MVALIGIPLRVIRSMCNRSDCFAYRTNQPHNCFCLTEAPDPCPFYKSKEAHIKQLAELRQRHKEGCRYDI